MSALLALLVLGGAIWFVATLAGGGTRREPVDSVNEFARAMSALNPTPPPTATRRPGVPARR